MSASTALSLNGDGGDDVVGKGDEEDEDEDEEAEEEETGVGPGTWLI